MKEPQLTNNIDASVSYLETLQLMNKDNQRVSFNTDGRTRLSRKQLLSIMAEMHRRGQEDMRRVSQEIIRTSGYGT